MAVDGGAARYGPKSFPRLFLVLADDVDDKLQVSRVFGAEEVGRRARLS